MLVFPCAHCNQTLSVPDTVAGKKVRCPRCQGVLEAPQSAPSGSLAGGPSAVPAPQTSSSLPPRDVSWMDAWRDELTITGLRILYERNQ